MRRKRGYSATPNGRLNQKKATNDQADRPGHVVQAG